MSSRQERRRRRKCFDDKVARRWNFHADAVVERLGKEEEEEKEAPCCKGGEKNNAASPSPLNVTASTVGLSFLDESFNDIVSNGGGMKINSPEMDTPAADDGDNNPESTNTVKVYFRFDDDDRPDAMKKKRGHKNRKNKESVLSPAGSQKNSTDSFFNGFTYLGELTPPEKDGVQEKEQAADTDWNLFDDDELVNLQAPPAPKSSFDEDDAVGRDLASPVGVHEIDSFAKRFDETESFHSRSVAGTSVNDDVLRSLRDENRRLKTELSKASEEVDEVTSSEGTDILRSILRDGNQSLNKSFKSSSVVDTSENDDVLRSLRDENKRLKAEVSIAIEGEGTRNKNTLDESALNTILDDINDLRTLEEGTLGDGTTSFHSETECGDTFDNMSFQSEMESVALGSIVSWEKGKGEIRRRDAVKDTGPSSYSDDNIPMCSNLCSTLFEELKGTYEDLNKSCSDIFHAFWISLDDVDKMSDVIRDGKQDLTVCHTDEFVPEASKSRSAFFEGRI